MAKEDKQADPLTRNPFAPVNLAERNLEKKRIREDQKQNRGRLMDCLDPTVAKYYEDRKPLYEWRVQAQIFRPAVGKQHAYMQKFDENVVAQNDRDAWSMFCDKISEWPARRDCSVTITRLQKRTLRGEPELSSPAE